MQKLVLNDENERLIWHGKKSVPTSILDALSTRWIILAILVLLIDILIFTGILLRTGPKSAAGYIMKTTWLHILPLAVYLLGALFSILRSATTDYIVTNKYVYIQYGLCKRTVVANDIDDIEYVSLYRDLYDKWTHTADITVFTSDEVEKDGQILPEEKLLKFENIRQADDVYVLIETIRKRTCSINDPEFLASLTKNFHTIE